MAKSNGGAHVIEVANRVATNNTTNGITWVADNLANHQSISNNDAHAISNISGLQVALDSKAEVSHVHAIENVTGLQAILEGKQNTIVGYTGILTIVTAVNFASSTVTTASVNIENGTIVSIT